jgi:glycosyltransferase involved in cell wall biosynthesis
MTLATLEPPVADLAAEQRPLRRALLIAYNFPPVGGAGVQRPVKWVKYLRRFGWDVTVLTTENPSVPARDESLLADLPDDLPVFRARTWEPDYRVKERLLDAADSNGFVQRMKRGLRGFVKRAVTLALQPDPQVLWNHNAIRVGRRILRERPHDAILVTAPPYSSFFIGEALKRQFGLPLVLDFRDEWDLSGRYLENAQRGWFSHRLQDRLQRRILRQSDAVTATTQSSAETLAEKLHALGHHVPTRCLYNGYDAEDFESDCDACPNETDDVRNQIQSVSTIDRQPSTRLRIVYTGTLWNLTRIDPLVAAIESIDASRPDLSQRLELVCVGRKTPEQLQVVERVGATRAHLRLMDYCDHSESLEWLRSADGLCLLLSDVPGAERVVPAKLFEYLASQRDLLAIVPAGETAEIVQRFRPGAHFPPDNVPGIAGWLTDRLVKFGDGTRSAARVSTARIDDGIDEYSRVSQTQKLAQLLDVLAHRR